MKSITPENDWPAVLSAYRAASREYQADCNLRRLRKPDEKRRQLREASNAAFKALCTAADQVLAR